MNLLRYRVSLAIALIVLLIACENSLIDKNPPTIANFSASATEIIYGEDTTLSWNVPTDGRVTVILNGGKQQNAASLVVQPGVDTTYKLTAFNSIEEVSRKITIKVNPLVVPIPNPEIPEQTPIPETPEQTPTPETPEQTPTPEIPVPIPTPETPGPEIPGPEIPSLPTGSTAELSEGVYSIVNIKNALCMDVSGSTQLSGQTVSQWDCHFGENQQWQLSNENGKYTFVAQHSSQFLTRSSGKLEQQPQYPQLENQQWYISKVAKGYKVLSTTENVCLSTDTSNNLVYGTCNISDAQIFHLKPNLSYTPSYSSTHGGTWSEKIDLPIVPVAASVLPNNTLLMWSSFDALRFGGRNGYTQTALYDLSTGQIEQREIALGHDMFCPGISLLEDGELLVNGGSDNFETSFYNFSNNSWRKGKDMNIGRGYHTTLTLTSGDVFTLGGSFGSGTTTSPEKLGELWNKNSQEWTTLTGATTTQLKDVGDPKYDEHPHLYEAANGNIFLAGPTPNLAWYNLSGTGNVFSAGQRGDDVHSQVGITAMFDVGKILKAGGASNYVGNEPASNRSYVMDINNPDTISVQKVSPMTYPRAFASSVVLPDGQVMVTGGATVAKVFDDSTAVKTPELWNPQTGSWRNLEAHAIPRTYHSVALLLPDARVLNAGGGLCGNCAVNHPDGELFSPPYLFSDDGKLAERPQITSVPTQLKYSKNFNVETSDEISSFSLVRMSSITHSINTDQRFIRLNGVVEANGSYSLKAPERNIAPPGYWMLFAFNNKGVPSVASIVQLSN